MSRRGCSDSAWLELTRTDEDSWQVTADWCSCLTADFTACLGTAEVADFAARMLSRLQAPSGGRFSEAVSPGRTLATFSRMLASETDRTMRLEVPRRLTGSAAVYCTDIIVARRHLPGRTLSTSVFPLLIAPEHTAMTMMLPSRFWPASAAES